MEMKKTVNKSTAKSDIMKKVAKKSGAKVVNLTYKKSKLQVEDWRGYPYPTPQSSSVTRLEEEVARLNNRVAELEKAQPKAAREPETFEDCMKLTQTPYILDSYGTPYYKGGKDGYLTSLKRADQLFAIAKMMTVAEALGVGGWYLRSVTVRGFHDRFEPFFSANGPEYRLVGFATEQKAEKAIKILGEDVIKTAYGL